VENFILEEWDEDIARSLSVEWFDDEVLVDRSGRDDDDDFIVSSMPGMRFLYLHVSPCDAGSSIAYPALENDRHDLCC
jgi:hypothetical protein